MYQEARRRLEELLDREIETARLLSTALAAERSALTGDSPEAVRQQAGEKVRLLEALDGLENERGKLCAAAGLGTAALGAAPDSSGITHRWHALMALIAGCRTANEVNGYIIHVRRNQIRQLMDIVRGSSPGGVYGPHGKTFAKSLRALAQA
jgi:flagella synthesis protein FlgN